jgi:hypothetical protein
MKLPYRVNVSSPRGAPMGRMSDDPELFKGRRVHLRRVPFVDSCYDQGGAYWGAPADLYCFWFDDGEEVREFYTRAPGRDKAKEKLPGAFFYR